MLTCCCQIWIPASCKTITFVNDGYRRWLYAPFTLIICRRSSFKKQTDWKPDNFSYASAIIHKKWNCDCQFLIPTSFNLNPEFFSMSWTILLIKVMLPFLFYQAWHFNNILQNFPKLTKKKCIIKTAKQNATNVNSNAPQKKLFANLYLSFSTLKSLLDFVTSFMQSSRSIANLQWRLLNYVTVRES